MTTDYKVLVSSVINHGTVTVNRTCSSENENKITGGKRWRRWLVRKRRWCRIIFKRVLRKLVLMMQI